MTLTADEVVLAPALSVARALSNVDGLCRLVNRGLAEHDTGGAGLIAIAKAADVINNAFDGCRFYIDCNPEPDDDILTKGGDFNQGPGGNLVTGFEPRVPSTFGLKQNYPNPFTSTVPDVYPVTITVTDECGAQVIQSFDLTVRDCAGAHLGGGIHLFLGRPTLTDCALLYNDVKPNPEGTHGGGLFISQDLSVNGRGQQPGVKCLPPTHAPRSIYQSQVRV